MNKEDLFKILNLKENSSIDEIKKAYKKYCLKNHPDKNKNNEELFTLVNSSYHKFIDENVIIFQLSIKDIYNNNLPKEILEINNYDFKQTIENDEINYEIKFIINDIQYILQVKSTYKYALTKKLDILIREPIEISYNEFIENFSKEIEIFDDKYILKSYGPFDNSNIFYIKSKNNKKFIVFKIFINNNFINQNFDVYNL